MTCACYNHIDTEPTKTRIVHCPMHAAAPEMLAKLEAWVKLDIGAHKYCKRKGCTNLLYHASRDLIVKAKGK